MGLDEALQPAEMECACNQKHVEKTRINVSLITENDMTSAIAELNTLLKHLSANTTFTANNFSINQW